MRVLLQRVARAEVRIRDAAAAPRVSGRIDRGYVLLVGFTTTDGEDQVAWMAEKVVGLRLFADAEDKMNLALADVGGAMLVVSQFTLYGDVRRGKRPSFDDAAPPPIAKEFYELFVQRIRRAGIQCETGRFQEMMQVSLVNEGPVTILIDSRRAF